MDFVFDKNININLFKNFCLKVLTAIYKIILLRN